MKELKKFELELTKTLITLLFSLACKILWREKGSVMTPTTYWAIDFISESVTCIPEFDNSNGKAVRVPLAELIVSR
jgi:hypothetical protein